VEAKHRQQYLEPAQDETDFIKVLESMAKIRNIAGKWKITKCDMVNGTLKTLSGAKYLFGWKLVVEKHETSG